MFNYDKLVSFEILFALKYRFMLSNNALKCKVRLRLLSAVKSQLLRKDIRIKTTQIFFKKLKFILFHISFLICLLLKKQDRILAKSCSEGFGLSTLLYLFLVPKGKINKLLHLQF